MPTYTRSNAIPNQPITLRTLFKRYGVPMDPADWGPVLITKKDPRDITYDPDTDLLETIPKASISHLSTGLFQYLTSNTSITATGQYFDVFKFKFEIDGPEYLVVNEFTVTTSGVPKLGYVTVDEIYDEGLSSTLYPAGRVNNRIALASKLVDKYTGWWFEARKMIMDVDGCGSFELSLDVPIVSIETVTLLDREFPPTEVFTFDLADLVVYNRHMTGMVTPDDRQDPRLGNVYFPKGRQNVRLNGTFGYTDSDGETPIEIKRAVMLMVLRDKELLASGLSRNASLNMSLAGQIISETTDDHRYELSTAKRTMGSTAYFTGDPEIDQLLLGFRRPPSLGRNLGANIVSRDMGNQIDRTRGGFDFFFGRSL